ncbi:MAG: hypothetical protein JOY83_26010 [Alphaproteobacteria bacterium]|nr:hypothetical protein [Alphaproteobacteria bacterium]
MTTEHLTKLIEMVDGGALKVHVEKTFPPEQAGAAPQNQGKESPRGKVALKVV